MSNTPSRAYLLGIDCGNTVIKAALFDLVGRELAVCSRSVETLQPAPGFTETDLGAHWTLCAQAIRGVLEQSGVAPNRIAGIGTSGHGNGLYLLDRAGEPLLGIQSMDGRAGPDLAVGDLDTDAILAINHQGIWAAQTPVLLRWLKRHRSEMFDRIGTAFLCKDYVGYRLTGERGSDLSDMSGCGLLDFTDNDYSDELLGLFDLSDARDRLPPLRVSTDLLGRVTAEAARATGLAEGTPVVAGVFDVVGSALGSGVERAGQASVIAGTWSVNQVVVERPPTPGSIFMSCCFDRDRYLAIESSATSTTNLEWFLRECGGDDHRTAERTGRSVYDLIGDRLNAIPLPSDLPIYLPYLFGAGAMGQARGGFYGVTGWHDRTSLTYALFEGVVFGHRHHLDRLRRAGVAFDSARLTGGGARSSYWSQLFSDILDIDIETAQGSETGALGAALAAGTGTGVFSDYADGVARMTTLAETYSPRAELYDFFEQRYHWFLELRTAMAPLWRQMADAAN